MSNAISSFIGGFRGGTRKNRFKVSGTFPVDGTQPDTKLNFHVLSASLPNSTLGIVNFPYRGRLIPYVGDRSYEPWDILVLDDRGADGLYKKFVGWSESINSQVNNTHNMGDTDNWFSDGNELIQNGTWSIEQLDLDESKLKKIQLEGCWPGFISPLQFNMAETGFNSFAVRLNYNFIKIETIN
jgi:hypothetical protein